MRNKIKLYDTKPSILIKMAEGNPGGLNVLIDLSHTMDDFFTYILSLDDMNIRGSQIWVGYKDYCNQNIDDFKNAIKARDPEMVRVINSVCSTYGELAVTHGASFNHA